MYNFFITKEQITGDTAIISGNDFNHIVNVLRFKVGDEFLVSADGVSHLCRLEQIDSDKVIAKITKENFNYTSLPISITLFQGLPKSDKMELIIQKAVELGAEKVIPVETERSIVKIEKKKQGAKVERWQAIAESAAKQCKRSIIPKIELPLSFTQAVNEINNYDLFLVPYENALGMQATKEILSQIKPNMKIGVLIGAEGGFSQKEIDSVIDAGAKTISLGKRILRTETAAITSLSMLMLHAEMHLN
ncbi:MAG: 16S rRNA (uracil(1498)-N(3))-methyltransferase [Clostridiales bacterium]|nr:16S rRNA (uracil(1498)-N(3))-methyltransferase [Clostridiales bacterium]